MINNSTLKIRISDSNETIRIYHSPHEVIVRPKVKKVEIHDFNGTLIETYELIEKKLSWLEDNELDIAEIMLDLKVNR